MKMIMDIIAMILNRNSTLLVITIIIMIMGMSTARSVGGSAGC